MIKQLYHSNVHKTDFLQKNRNLFNLFNFPGFPGMQQSSGSFEDLLHRLFEEHSNRGPPPADKTVVEKLPKKQISELEGVFKYVCLVVNLEYLFIICKIFTESQEIECSVCKDCFSVGDEAIVLPCNHLYHPDCILPWLKDVSLFCFYYFLLSEKNRETLALLVDMNCPLKRNHQTLLLIIIVIIIEIIMMTVGLTTKRTICICRKDTPNKTLLYLLSLR